MEFVEQTEWRVHITKDLDTDLRDFLREDGRTGPGALSEFITEVVQERLFDEAAQRAKKANAGTSEEEILAAVDESLEWARSQR